MKKEKQKLVTRDKNKTIQNEANEKKT